jgi:hypothetical protein
MKDGVGHQEYKKSRTAFRAARPKRCCFRSKAECAFVQKCVKSVGARVEAYLDDPGAIVDDAPEVAVEDIVPDRKVFERFAFAVGAVITDIGTEIHIEKLVGFHKRASTRFSGEADVPAVEPDAVELICVVYPAVDATLFMNSCMMKPFL